MNMYDESFRRLTLVVLAVHDMPIIVVNYEYTEAQEPPRKLPSRCEEECRQYTSNSKFQTQHKPRPGSFGKEEIRWCLTVYNIEMKRYVDITDHSRRTASVHSQIESSSSCKNIVKRTYGQVDAIDTNTEVVEEDVYAIVLISYPHYTLM